MIVRWLVNPSDTPRPHILLPPAFSRVSRHLGAGDTWGGTALLVPLFLPGGSSLCPSVLVSKPPLLLAHTLNAVVMGLSPVMAQPGNAVEKYKIPGPIPDPILALLRILFSREGLRSLYF